MNRSVIILFLSVVLILSLYVSFTDVSVAAEPVAEPAAAPTAEISTVFEQLAGIGDGIVDYWVSQLMKVSADGSSVIEYNWNIIEAWMQLESGEQDGAHLAALVFVYLSMENPDDIARFIAAGYHGVNSPHSVTYDYLHLIYAQTEMMRALTESVVAVVTQQAMVTVWATSTSDAVVEQSVRNMQALQVMSRLADTITTLPDLEMRGMVEKGEYSATPIRLTINDAGVWFIQYAVYNEEPIYGEPPQYAMTEAVALGNRGTSMGSPWDAGEYARYHYVNLVTDGFIEAFVRGESGNSPRDMFTPSNISALISNAASATMVIAGVGYIIDVIDSYIESAERLNAAQSFLDEGALYSGIDDLGGLICFTPISGVNIVHGINLQTGTALLRTAGFLYTYDYEITVEQLHMIILNGDQNTGASPIESLEGIDIDAALQREIFNRYYRYIYHQEPNQESEHVAYRRALRRTAVAIMGEITNLFGSAYDVDFVVFGEDVEVLDWPVEILAYVIERFNNPNSATQAVT